MKSDSNLPVQALTSLVQALTYPRLGVVSQQNRSSAGTRSRRAKWIAPLDSASRDRYQRPQANPPSFTVSRAQKLKSLSENFYKSQGGGKINMDLSDAEFNEDSEKPHVEGSARLRFAPRQQNPLLPLMTP